MFYSKIKALQELPQNGNHFRQNAYGKCMCKSKIILSTLYSLDTFRYDPVSLSMTISYLQIAVFLNSHPAVGLRPAMTTGGLDYLGFLIFQKLFSQTLRLQSDFQASLKSSIFWAVCIVYSLGKISNKSAIWYNLLLYTLLKLQSLKTWIYFWHNYAFQKQFYHYY